MQEVRYQPGEVIVQENNLIDSVLIIERGQAEISHQEIKISKLTKKKKIINTPLATIEAGDAIGLNDTGFFSTTGKRTATVTAITQVTVLLIDLVSLHFFLKVHPNLQTEMYKAAEQLLRVKLIRQSLPFSHLSYERLLWLAKQVEVETVEPNTVIFSQGEMGDRCYLIQSGKVEIFRKNQDGSEHHIITLKSPTIFGEATLITHAPRNASARSLEKCELLVLKHEFLTELLATEGDVANMFMTLMVDRSRPQKNPHILVHHRTTVDNQPIVILKNPDNGNYFKLSTEGWYIWKQLNGKNTMQDITLSLAEKFNLFAPDVVAALISKLAKAGFINNIEVSEKELTKQPLWIRTVLRVRNILEARVAIGDIDNKLSTIYKKWAYWFFSFKGKILLGAITLLGLLSWALATRNIVHVFSTMPNAWMLLFLLIPFSVLAVALHEMGHAMTTKSFGHEVHYMGVGWYWLSPVAFTDTSDMWLSSRAPRIKVNLAGIAMDLIVAGLASLFIFVIPHPYIQAFLWLFSAYTYINAFRMLSPLQELDGYYVLMDLVDKPHLRQSAVVWLVNDFPKIFKHPASIKQAWPEVLYWLVCLVYLILTVFLVLVVQAFIFKMLGVQPSSPLMSLILPFIVVVVSSLGVIAEIRSQEF
jgi:putative peptide zinc metalloprotease protein